MLYLQMTAEKLKECIPSATKEHCELFAGPLTGAMEEYEIKTTRRQAAFLAQIAHESGSLKYVEEIASGEAYEGRKDLGNTQPGDGKRFKGRGLIQITGRSNYTELSKELHYDFIVHPKALERPGAASYSAAWFWWSRHLNRLADIDAFLKISIRINGVNPKTGKPNGWADRLEHWERCKKALGVDEKDIDSPRKLNEIP
jgi:putative chitinase